MIAKLSIRLYEHADSVNTSKNFSYATIINETGESYFKLIMPDGKEYFCPLEELLNVSRALPGI